MVQSKIQNLRHNTWRIRQAGWRTKSKIRTTRIPVVSCSRAGRLVPPQAKGLRAGSVILKPGEAMGWHSTGPREELLLALAGRVRIEVQPRRRRAQSVALTVGQCAFLPTRTPHRVVNQSRSIARYLYITAPIQ